MNNHLRFRYDFRVDYYMNVHINCTKFRVVKETDCYEWVVHVDAGVHLKAWTTTNLRRYGAKRLTKNAVRRFAYPTKDEAFHSFIRRQMRSVDFATHQKKNAEAALRACGVKDEGGYWDRSTAKMPAEADAR